MISIGIIGCGFVGGAISRGFKHYTDVKVYDKATDYKFDYVDVVNQDILFVCLPTPMKEDGSVELKILFGALERISDTLNDSLKPVIIKSTIPPGICQDMSRRFPNLCIIYNPEFLTERTSDLDFLQQSRIILGVGSDEKSVPIGNVIELFKSRFPGVPIKKMHWDEASLIKYFTNVFFCTKVGIFNEFCQVAESLGLDGNEIVEEVLNDGRIARSHWMVPGWDGKRGFGGSCFPKDINGFIEFAKKLGIDPLISEAVWAKNLEVRPDRDWENLKGRAISDETKN